MSYDLQTLRGDIAGGLAATCTSLAPVATFGAVSGLGVASGFYGAVAVGLFVGLFERARPQMAHSSSVLAVAVAAVVATHADSPAKALTVVMLAGAMQMLMGALRLGSYVTYTPYSVIAGYMSGIGIMLVTSMALVFFGAPIKVAKPLTSFEALPGALADLNAGALVVGASALALALLWPRRLRRVAPAPMAAIVIGTLISVIWFADVPTIGELPKGLPALHAPVLSLDLLADSLLPALTIALLSTVRGLLWLVAVDARTRTQCDPDRALIANGAGNIAAGLIGGLPGNLKFSTTMVSIRTGASTRLAALVRATLLLAIVLGLAGPLQYLPHAALAAVLGALGWNMIDWRFLARIRRVQREHLLVMAATLALTVFVDIVTAVAVGLIVAGMVGARQLERLQLDSVVSVPLLDQVFLREDAPEADADHEGAISPYSARAGMVKLRGSFTVASSSKLIRTIGDDIVGHQLVILDFSETDYIDDSAALVIEQLIDAAAAEGVHCLVMKLDGAPAATLESLNALRRIPAEHRLASLDEARDVARQLLG